MPKITKKKYHTKRKRKALRRLKNVLYASLALVISYGFFTGFKYWIAHSDIFYITRLEITGTNMLTINEVKESVHIDSEQKLFELELDAIKQDLLDNPFIADAALGRKYPSTLKVKVVERVPVAYIALEKLYFVDNDGIILPKKINAVHHTDYPVITGIKVNNVIPGEISGSNRILKALEFLRASKTELPELASQISEVHYDVKTGVSVFLSDGGLRVDFGEGNFARKLSRLQYFLAYQSQEEDAQQLQYINMNYQDMIVVK